MGRSNRQRRTDKKRRAAQHAADGRSRIRTTGGRDGEQRSGPTAADLQQVDLQQMIVAAARSAAMPGRDPSALVAALVMIERDPVGLERPSTVVATMLERCLDSMYEHGWQPADVAHFVKRNGTARAARLILAIIAGDARRRDAGLRAPQAWLDQLEGLGVLEPIGNTIDGGHDDAFDRWWRAEQLDPDEFLTIALRVLGLVLTSGRLARLLPPPTAWPASNRGMFPRPATAVGDIDAKALKLIRALLAKAEATTFEAEAETFTSKAQEMMSRYSIDAAVLAAAGHADGAPPSGVESRRVHIDSPYADEKATFLAVIADVNGARSIWSPHVGFATMTGFPVDLHLTDVLFTSLLVQATRASAQATSTDRYLRTASFRRAFLVSFANRVGERLTTTSRDVAAEAERQYGSALVPILADRERAVAEESARIFPDTTVMSSRRYDAEGWHAGRAAADRARITTGEALAR